MTDVWWTTEIAERVEQLPRIAADALALRERVERLATKYERLADDEDLPRPAADAFHDAALDLRRALGDES